MKLPSYPRGYLSPDDDLDRYIPQAVWNCRLGRWNSCKKDRAFSYVGLRLWNAPAEEFMRSANFPAKCRFLQSTQTRDRNGRDLLLNNKCFTEPPFRLYNWATHPSLRQEYLRKKEKTFISPQFSGNVNTPYTNRGSYSFSTPLTYMVVKPWKTIKHHEKNTACVPKQAQLATLWLT